MGNDARVLEIKNASNELMSNPRFINYMNTI
jgi:hypothetical protein